MKRIFVIALLALFAVSLATVAFAEDTGGKCPMTEKCGKGMGMCPKCGMMMKSALEKEMAASDNGSVIILAGNKLMKYNKDLELEKEVEIKYDTKSACEKLCKNCPCHQKMIQAAEAKPAPAEATAEAVEKNIKK